MHDQGTPEQEDLRAQAAVLSLVLHEHPTLLSFGDLLMETEEEDAAERAVRDLIALGLLRREGGLVLASRAALRFDGLLA